MRGMSERRTETRMLCADMIEVSWKEHTGKKRQAMGLLEDISLSGACLQMESPIPVGVETSWKHPSQQFTGVVRYCTYQEIGYFVGVKFAPGIKWSEDVFKPGHLLDVEELVKKPATAGFPVH